MHNRAIPFEQACEARAGLGLSVVEPIPDLGRVLRVVKSMTFVRTPFHGDVAGCFARAGDQAVIIVNSALSQGRQNFTAAHEYYHALFNKGLQAFVCVADDTGRRPKVERDADAFAAELLMPEAAIELQLCRHTGMRRRLEMDDAIRLEQYFGVSHSAMLTRLNVLGLLSKRDKAALGTESVIRAATMLGYEPDLYRPTGDEMVISPIPSMALEALQKGRISEGKYAQILTECGLSHILYSKEEASNAEGETRDPAGCR